MLTNDTDKNSNFNPDKNSNLHHEKDTNINNILINFEQQFHQLLLESKSNEFIIKTTQENLNNCLKQNLLLKHEVETERLKKSMIKMELETLTTMLRKCNYKNNSELNVKVLMHEREHLTNKIYQLKIENIELKQALTKSNNQIQSLTEKQHECTEKINLVTPILNSLQLQINKQKKDSDTLINLLCVSKNLARKILSALEYTRKSNKIQSDHIQNLIKEVASIKSQIHIFIDQNEKQQSMNTNQQNLISSTRIHSEIYMKIVEILEIENSTLHKSVQFLNKGKLKDDIDK
ncbi:Hypothetical protein CINCED_3A012253 [Cinara cedri]|uniref:Uncharacterized protein n=1 Tax=Cinara cedri TaxID=506608 RepID=A0A5E4NBK9_9HEMI|nr:Hypothetical protein CINCED_3A012253 [Cinara cedri]